MQLNHNARVSLPIFPTQLQQPCAGNLEIWQALNVKQKWKQRPPLRLDSSYCTRQLRQRQTYFLHNMRGSRRNCQNAFGLTFSWQQGSQGGFWMCTFLSANRTICTYWPCIDTIFTILLASHSTLSALALRASLTESVFVFCLIEVSGYMIYRLEGITTDLKKAQFFTDKVPWPCHGSILSLRLAITRRSQKIGDCIFASHRGLRESFFAINWSQPRVVRLLWLWCERAKCVEGSQVTKKGFKIQSRAEFS